MERLSRQSDGQILLRFKRALADGSTEVRLQPMEFLRRLASLVPPPGFHLVAYYGIFGSRSKLRRDNFSAASGPLGRLEGPPKTTPRSTVDSEEETNLFPLFPSSEPKARCLSWAELLRRTRGIDVLRCEQCGGQMKLLAFVTEPNLAAEILERLGLQPSSPDPPA
jgi:hypothetical protein